MADELGGAVVTRKTWCEYLAPATVYDEIAVKLSVAKVGTTSYTLGFEMVRVGDAVVVARSGLVGVFVAGGRAAPLPPVLRDALLGGMA
jgi:acyl-CoA thioesterase FadM